MTRQSISALSLVRFRATLQNSITALEAVELGIVWQGPSTGSAIPNTFEFYGFAVTTDLASLGLVLVPEPSTLSLLAIGMLTACRRRRSSCPRSGLAVSNRVDALFSTRKTVDTAFI